ncbi:19726_t:CDS:2 [Entrophospora sp. SA101]|nr:8027_t:CDS:2 [Entrophospora sp. SA101]CAJ0630632.1 512_t:CDS:2 [Entrophospora sp. SA101]CAJ0630640.1 517_t:CDS:2 [Entrophospora sp. SA101]CAJ0745616.1 19726_t:CDS:2 [Entrophospora sp. SA101]CAJ0885710.1 1113_t:CDS:2 [Entrophospora sp. SA101]
MTKTCDGCACGASCKCGTDCKCEKTSTAKVNCGASHKYDDDNKNMNNQNTQLLVIYKECGLGEELFFDNIKSLDKLKIE